MTLHEAIEKVLKQNGRPMAAREIADEINTQQLYQRSDNLPVLAIQVTARVGKYPSLFFKNGLGDIELVSEYPIEEVKNDWEFTMRQIKEKHVEIAEAFSKLQEGMMNKREFDKYLKSLVKDFITTFPLKGKLNRDLFIALFFLLFFRTKENEDIGYKDLFDPILDIISLNKKAKTLGIFDFILKENEKEVYEFFEKNMTQDYANQIFEIHTLVLFLCSEVKIEFVGNFFIDAMIDNVLGVDQKTQIYKTPEYLAKLLIQLTDIKAGDSLYDPAAGYGSLLLQAYQQNESINVFGQEINGLINAIALMAAALEGIQISNFQIGNSLLNQHSSKKKFNKIVCNPPYGRVNSPIRQSLWFKNETQSNRLEVLFLNMMLNSISTGGQVTTLVPDNLLFNMESMKLRKKIIDDYFLKAVISLPPCLMDRSSMVDSSILVIENTQVQKSENLSVTFIDAKNFHIDKNDRWANEKIEDLIKSIVEIIRPSGLVENIEIRQNLRVKNEPIESIAQNNYDFSPGYYTNPVREKIKMIEQNEKLVALGDIVKPYRSGTTAGLFEKDFIVKIEKLSDSPNDPYLDFNKLTEVVNAPKVYKHVYKTTLLVSKLGGKLKPTIFQYTGNAVQVNPNIFVFDMDETRVNKEYLVYQLVSPFVEEQLMLFRRGLIGRISLESFNKVLIPLPDLSSQLNWVIERRKEKEKENRLLRFVNDINLVEGQSEIKSAIEQYAKLQFPGSLNVSFNTILEIVKNPFTENEVESGVCIKSTPDKLYYHLYLSDKSNNINGVLTVDAAEPIDQDKYDEVNAYFTFLNKTSKFIARSNAMNNLSRFAHTSKNFFAGLSTDFDALLNTQNPTLKNALETLLVDRDDFIERKIKMGSDKREDFLAINYLEKLKNKISSIAEFYQKTSLIYKAMIEQESQKIELSEILKVSDTMNVLEGNNFTNQFVLAKEHPLKQAFVDILQNCHKYSPNKFCNLKIDNKTNHVVLHFENEVDDSNIRSESDYKLLGKKWLTKVDNDGASSGLYWAFEAIKDSNGEISIADYKTYSEKKKFIVTIKLLKYYE